MRYVDPKAAVLYLLNTGQTEILQKVDPSRRAELAHWLKQAKQGLIQKTTAQTQYQKLLAKARAGQGATAQSGRPRGRASIAYDAAVSRQTWETGQSFNDLRKNKFRYVSIGSTSAAGGGANADAIGDLLSDLEKGD
jgi:hypothetical protein